MRRAALLLLLLLFLLPAAAAARTPPPVSAPTQGGRRAVAEGDLFLRVPVPAKGGLRAVARKYTGDAENAEELKRANPVRRGRRLREARVPLDLLTRPYAEELIRALFPKDRRAKNGWDHHWERGSWPELARWFTGDADNAPNLKAANPKLKRLGKGERVLIPYGLLADPFRRFGAENAEEAHAPPPREPPRAVGPPAPAPTPAAPPGPGLPGPAPEGAAPPAEPADAGRALLAYGRDDRGAYAVYRLQPHEALYSAVVVRFTGNVDAADVNALAGEIAKRNGIADVTAIPVGFPVKIPLDDLLPQYLPATDARYQAWLQNRSRTGGVRNTAKSAALDGVVVILDAGHGGLDRGAVKNRVWEDSYVYDIVCRIHEGLERRTKARVLLTLMVPSLGQKPQEKRGLTPNTDAVILTHPWFKQESTAETKVEVNLRWYLANQYFARLAKEGTDPARVVFTSVHADSLHPSLRGTMFYVPGTPYRSERWSQAGETYKRYAEYRARPSYELDRDALIESEGLSRQFAAALEKAFKERGLPLHPYSPTRDHVIRGRRSWVPAVLRNAITPCSLLVEVCNIANAEDAELLRDPAYRESVAEAYIDALIAYYS